MTETLNLSHPKRWLEKMYNEGTLQLDYKSCEMIADDMYKEIQTKISQT